MVSSSEEKLNIKAAADALAVAIEYPPMPFRPEALFDATTSVKGTQS